MRPVAHLLGGMQSFDLQLAIEGQVTKKMRAMRLTMMMIDGVTRGHHSHAALWKLIIVTAR